MDQIKQLLSGLSIRQKLSIAATLLLVGGGILALIRWKHESDFHVLYSSMAPEDAAMVVQKLKETGVEYRLLDNGSGVMAPSSKLAEARLALAAAGLPKTGRIGFELFDKTNFGATELVEHINYQRALEGELERSVMSISEVETARVHISLPKDSVFLDQQQPAKASVMMKLHTGAKISPQNVIAVSHLVASAVQGLSPDAVSIIDTDGRLLSRPVRAANDGTQITTETLEIRQQLERELVAKVNATLEPLLGADRFRTGAFVDCDLTSAEQQEETYDPSKSVMVSSQKTEDVSARISSSGVPGTASNLPRPQTSNDGGTGNDVSRKTENIAYASSRTVRKTRIPQGIVKRMSISVLVANETKWEGEGKTRHRVTVPPDPETLKSIKELVAGVTGFDEDRGDQLIVDSLPFGTVVTSDPQSAPAGTAPVSSVSAPAWLNLLKKYWQIAGLSVLGLIAVIVLMSGAMRARTREVIQDVEVKDDIALAAPVAEPPLPKAPVLPVIPSPAESAAHDMLGQTRASAQRDPNVTANVLRLWLQDLRATNFDL